MGNKMRTECPVCHCPAVVDFFYREAVPQFCNVLHDSRQSAITAPRGDLVMAYCGKCGHIFNRAFDSGHVNYRGMYENSLDFSPRFQDYSRKLAERLFTLFDLHKKTIVEIGCGRGKFLEFLCSQGNNHGIGFDPSHVSVDSDVLNQGQSGTVRFISDYFGEKYDYVKADMVIGRHVLEHVYEPANFIRDIRTASVDHAGLYLEVPNALHVFSDKGVWDIIYEHVSYFTASSLSVLVRRAGYRFVSLKQDYGGQFLSVAAEAGAGDFAPHKVEKEEGFSRAIVENFNRWFAERIEEWEKRLTELVCHNRRVVIWGGGSKGVMFLNNISTAGAVDGVIDINPMKQGHYIPGTGHQIVSPDSLQKSKPDVIIIMNPLYAEEIETFCRNVGIGVELTVV